MNRLFVLALLCGLAVWACDESPSPQNDPEPDARSGDAAPDTLDALMPDGLTLDARPPDADPQDVGSLDAAIPDTGVPDSDAAGSDAIASDAAPDAEAPDATDTPDAEVLDAGTDAASNADAATPDAAIPSTFVVGEAFAADGLTQVTVRAGDRSTLADIQGRFVLGPFPAGPVTLRFDAPAHQSETATLELPAEGEIALPEPMWLYRGTRIAGMEAEHPFFHFNDRWLFWQVADALHVTPTQQLDPRELIPQNFEVYLGPGPADLTSLGLPEEEWIQVRTRSLPGVAGDLALYGLNSGLHIPLFQEAQPWLHWQGTQVLGAVRTRQGLSALEVMQPNEAPRVLTEQLPWLLFAELGDGSVAFAQGSPPAYDIIKVRLDGSARERLTPEVGRAAPTFLSTTPGRTGLLWITPESTLWRYEPATGAQPIAEAVLTSPRPWFFPDGRLAFWRRTASGQDSLYLLDADGHETLGINEANATTLRLLDDNLFYIFKSGQGLYFGELAGEGGTVIPGNRVYTIHSGSGVIAQVGDVVYRHKPLGQTEQMLSGSSTIVSVIGGVLSYNVDARTMTFIPNSDTGGDARLVFENVDSSSIQFDVGGAPILHIDGQLVRSNVELTQTTIIEPNLITLIPTKPNALMGIDDERTIWQIDPRTGIGTSWAFNALQLIRSNNTNHILYRCDRGLFLVTLP